MATEIRTFMQQHHPLNLLTEDERQRVVDTMDTQAFATGTRILAQGGATSAYLYLVAAGQAQLLRDGEEVQILEEGDCFGYPSIINRTQPAFDVVARSDMVAHRLPAGVFQDLLQNARFAEFFLKNLGERLQSLTRRKLATPGAELTTAIGALLRRPPVVVSHGVTVADTARAMRDAREDVAIVAGDVPGIVTDHDFQARVLAEGRGPDTPIVDVMSRPIKTLPRDTPVHGALLFMLEERIHHLPVTGEDGIVGIVSATDLLRHQTSNPVYLMHRLDHLDDPASLVSYSHDAAAMVEHLFNGGLKVDEIGRILASLNDALVRRLCRLAEEDLGPPPCPYAWLVFGSEGRMEQALLTDQDNALVYADDTDAAHRYFGLLAERVVQDLVTAGFPLCTGGCMATNWRKPIAAWQATLAEWIREPTPDNLMVSSIFFDFRAVAGRLAVEPLLDLVAGAAENDLFMAHLARVSLRFRPPLGLFQRIRTEDGRVDLKKRGLASIVAAARVWGLEAGARGRPTRERLEAAMQAGVVSQDLGQTLVETYRFLLHLRLREQLAALAAGATIENHVLLKNLSSLETRHLKDAFGAVQEMQGAVARRYSTADLG